MNRGDNLEVGSLANDLSTNNKGFGYETSARRLQSFKPESGDSVARLRGDDNHARWYQRRHCEGPSNCNSRFEHPATSG